MIYVDGQVVTLSACAYFMLLLFYNICLVVIDDCSGHARSLFSEVQQLYLSWCCSQEYSFSCTIAFYSFACSC